MCGCLWVRFDKADGLYDTGDAWSDMRSEFDSRATYRMKVGNCYCMYVCMYVLFESFFHI